MASAFPESGNIEPETFPHLLVDLHRRGATGSLKVTGSAHPKALYFRGGRILFGSSNDPRDQLGSILIESGKISREQLDEVNVKVGPGNPLAKVLAESGFVNQRELGDAARIKVERILADLLGCEDGAFEFEVGVLPKGAVDLKLSTEKLLLAAVQRVPDRAFALRHVELRTVLEPTPEADAALTEIRAEVWPLLERLDGERSLKDAIALTRLDEFEAAKTACALLFLGAVRKRASPTEGEELDLAQEAQNGLGAGAPFSPSRSPVASGPAAFVEPGDAEEEDAGRPFVFPEAAPPAPPEAGATAAYQAIAESEPDEPFVFSGSAPALAYTPSFPEAEPAAEQTESIREEEVTGFAVSEPDFGAGSAMTDDGADRPTVILPSLAGADAPPFAMPSPTPLVPSDTQPGSRPLPSMPFDLPPAPTPAPMPTRVEPQAMPRPNSTAPSLPEIVAPPSASRPTSEDLAALDALLATPGRNAKAPERASATGWEPQFRPRTTPPRRMPARTGTPGGSSRVPLLVTGAIGVLLATAAAWFFLLRQPSPTPTPTPTPGPTGEPPISIDAPTTLATAGRPAPTMPSAAPPTTEATPPPPTSTAPVTRATPPPAAPPTPAPAPTARPSASQPQGTAADARGLLRQGSLPEAARAFAAALAPSRGAHSIQLLTACSPETVQKAVGAVGGDELFILPVVLTGRSCFRVCWGVYDTRPAAEAALGRVPAYFRQGGAKPRVSPLGELLP